jgi:2-polyprenyl-3-methyl-5-hydroxy-6-metoxy-1,4-benzoquinol methylase
LSIKLAKLGAQVTGIDISPEMIKFAIDNAASAGDSVALPAFSVCSIEDMQDLQDSSFDRIVSNYVLQDTPNLEKAIKVICGRVHRDCILIFRNFIAFWLRMGK